MKNTFVKKNSAVSAGESKEIKQVGEISESKENKESKLKFNKDLFKRSVEYNVRTLYRKDMSEATPQQVFQAASLAIKDQIIENWIKTQKAYDKEDPKMVYYMSMEFLMGRALGNNIINLQASKPVKEALDELGFDLNLVEDQEPDAALGNGGLGRLAASWTRWQLWGIPHTAVASATVTVCLSRKSVTAIRWRCRIIGLRTGILLNSAAPNMRRW